jgi:3-hydroxyisobutyrate dehydrogenase-like beta-hydroxyacid dehydrogenase
MAKKNIGFVGVGTMGQHMARNISKHGACVLIWDDFPQHMERLSGDNIHKAASRADRMSRADVVVIMLNTAEVIDRLFFQPDDNGSVAIDAAAGEKIAILMSSVAVSDCLGFSDKFLRHGVRMVDAPVSGGEGGARDGTLSIEKLDDA